LTDVAKLATGDIGRSVALSYYKTLRRQAGEAAGGAQIRRDVAELRLGGRELGISYGFVLTVLTVAVSVGPVVKNLWSYMLR
jgi:hypothetical protein